MTPQETKRRLEAEIGMLKRRRDALNEQARRAEQRHADAMGMTRDERREHMRNLWAERYPGVIA